MIVRAADLSDPEVLTLLKAHLAGMHAHSPPGSVHALEPDALRSPDVSLYAVWEGADLMAIGALQEIDATSASQAWVCCLPSRIPDYHRALAGLSPPQSGNGLRSCLRAGAGALSPVRI